MRDVAVIGVQTCALPISLPALVRMPPPRRRPSLRLVAPAAVALACLIVGATLVRGVLQVQRIECCWPDVRAGDRKSTRLNSSHGYISYAVFCLKKKKNKVIRNKSRHGKLNCVCR